MKGKNLLEDLPEISVKEAMQLIQENGATDRYQALGIPYPDPATMCKGQCEGMGFYPVKNDDDIETLEYTAWLEKHTAPDTHSDEPCDGWHFISCMECGGTGKAVSNTVH